MRSAHSIVVVSPVPLARVLPDDVDREILIRLPETATLGINYDIPGDDENAQFVLQHRGWSYASKDAYKFVTVKARNGAPAAMVTLPAGEYSLARSRRAWMGHGEGGYSCESQKIELQPGQTLTLDVTRRQGQSLTGELVFPLDAIVSGANVLVQRAGSEQLDALVAMQKGQMLDVATCGAEGKWKTQLIPPGDYVLTAEAYAPPSEPSYASIVFEIQGPTYTGIARMTVPETGQAPPVLIPMEPVRAKTPNAARSARRR